MNWTQAEDDIVSAYIGADTLGSVRARTALLLAGFRRSRAGVYERVALLRRRAAGPALAPAKVAPEPARRVPAKVNHLSMAIAMRQLLEGPVTSHDVVEATGLHIVTACKLFVALRSQKVVHISAWERDALGRDCTPVFTLGAGRDKARRRKTGAQRALAYRARRTGREMSAALTGHNQTGAQG